MKKTLALTLASDLDELDRIERFVQEITNLVPCDTDTKHNIMLVLTEAVSNAILHGNRQQADKSVEVRAELEPGRIVLTVQDEGGGFDPENIPDPLEKNNILKSSGRGVWLMHEFSGKVRFLDGGRKVELVFDV
jgi:serine/threonine-protein kinase RsbW